MANNLLAQVQQLKAMIEHAKQQSISGKESTLHQLKAQMEKEKSEVNTYYLHLLNSQGIFRMPALSAFHDDHVHVKVCMYAVDSASSTSILTHPTRVPSFGGQKHTIPTPGICHPCIGSAA